MMMKKCPTDQMVSTPPDYEILDEEENQEDDDNVMGGEQEDEEMYGDLNLNLDKRDVEMTDAHHYSRRRKRFTRLLTTNPPLKQTNQFAEALSSIPGIVDNYLASKMKDAVNVAVQLQSNKLREEAQAENDEILKQIDSNIKAKSKIRLKLKYPRSCQRLRSMSQNL
ncbi:hypothetical protein Tco_1106714 [Tanacetum coccineum]